MNVKLGRCSDCGRPWLLDQMWVKDDGRCLCYPCGEEEAKKLERWAEIAFSMGELAQAIDRKREIDKHLPKPHRGIGRIG